MCLNSEKSGHETGEAETTVHYMVMKVWKHALTHNYFYRRNQTAHDAIKKIFITYLG
jgi:hypothetical protein